MNPFERYAAEMVAKWSPADVARLATAGARATRKIADAQAAMLAYAGVETLEAWMGLLAAAAGEEVEGDATWALDLGPLLVEAQARLLEFEAVGRNGHREEVGV